MASLRKQWQILLTSFTQCFVYKSLNNKQWETIPGAQECRIPVSRLVVPITGIEKILLSPDLSQSFDSRICCSQLLSGKIWTGELKINQSSLYGLFLRDVKCLIALKMKKGQNACLLEWVHSSYRLFYKRCMTLHNSYIQNKIYSKLSCYDSSDLE